MSETTGTYAASCSKRQICLEMLSFARSMPQTTCHSSFFALGRSAFSAESARNQCPTTHAIACRLLTSELPLSIAACKTLSSDNWHNFVLKSCAASCKATRNKSSAAKVSTFCLFCIASIHLEDKSFASPCRTDVTCFKTDTACIKKSNTAFETPIVSFLSISSIFCSTVLCTAYFSAARPSFESARHSAIFSCVERTDLLPSQNSDCIALSKTEKICTLSNVLIVLFLNDTHRCASKRAKCRPNHTKKNCAYGKRKVSEWCTK